jgi:hypothetical protein
MYAMEEQATATANAEDAEDAEDAEGRGGARRGAEEKAKANAMGAMFKRNVRNGDIAKELRGFRGGRVLMR